MNIHDIENLKYWWVDFKRMCKMYDVFCALTIVAVILFLSTLLTYLYVLC